MRTIEEFISELAEKDIAVHEGPTSRITSIRAKVEKEALLVDEINQLVDAGRLRIWEKSSGKSGTHFSNSLIRQTSSLKKKNRSGIGRNILTILISSTQGHFLSKISITCLLSITMEILKTLNGG